MRAPLSTAALTLAALVVAGVGSAQSLPGTWVGTWLRDGASLPVTMRFERSATGYRGTFDAEALRAVEIPLSDIAYNPPTVKWRVVGDATTSEFEGTLAGQRLEGRFADGDARGRFVLQRAPNSPLRATREIVTFSNGTVSLAGTVIVPPGPGPHPGIVFLHGSGPEGRWASFFLAEQFAARGFVALCFDKRGVGDSGGDWRHATPADLASDGAAAVAALAARPDVSPGRIGIHGHSQGGFLAPLTAARIGAPAFVIASGAGGVPAGEMEAYSIENEIGVPRMTDAEAHDARAFVAALVATAYGGAPRDSLLSVYASIRSRSWAFEPPPASDPYWNFSRQLAAYDPLAFWQRVSAPTLLVYGEADERVPPRRSAARIAAAYLDGSGASIEVLVLPHADHSFRIPPAAGTSFAWPVTAPGYPAQLVDWALRQVSTSTPRAVANRPLPAGRARSTQPGLDAAHVP